jgi:hypothetical protein
MSSVGDPPAAFVCGSTFAPRRLDGRCDHTRQRARDSCALRREGIENVEIFNTLCAFNTSTASSLWLILASPLILGCGREDLLRESFIYIEGWALSSDSLPFLFSALHRLPWLATSLPAPAEATHSRAPSVQASAQHWISSLATHH